MMLKSIFRVLGVLSVTTPTMAWAGYGDLLEDWTSYEPTPYYESQLHPQQIEETAKATHEEDFSNQISRLREMKLRWEKALEALQEEELFYKPDQDLLDSLRPAEADPDAAAAVLTNELSLEKLVTLASLRYPGVKAAESKFKAALERYDQVWNLDEILRQYTAFTEALMTGVGPMKGREPVEKRFPFPGVLSLKGEVVTQEVKAATEALAIARRTAVTVARKSFWELLFVYRAQEITEEMLFLLRRLEDVATTRYEAGETSFQDVIKVRIQRETLEEDLTTLRERQRNIELKILEVIDLPPTIKVSAPAGQAPDREVPDLDALYQLSLRKRQEVRRLRAQIGKMERMIEMVETAIYPDFSLNLSLYEDEAVNQVGTGRSREPFGVTTTASRGAGLPKMPWYGANDAYLRETRKRLKAMRHELEKIENKTIFNVREAWFRLDRARREEALYAESVVNLSQAALEVSTRGYETGKVSFADVIASYTTWLQANLASERKKSDLGVAHAELEEAVGGPLK